jgi:hypothetical protein
VDGTEVKEVPAQQGGQGLHYRYGAALADMNIQLAESTLAGGFDEKQPRPFYVIANAAADSPGKP